MKINSKQLNFLFTGKKNPEKQLSRFNRIVKIIRFLNNFRV